MSYKGEGRYPDCLHLKNLPSLCLVLIWVGHVPLGFTSI
ncbi:hypothetical protein PARMER_00351 [Parabacteroides merdae ATCC 43184]|nr:hypothetical protein PARMER_01480 [Parabacteroides merdae ATCC 43184]EDN88233.1 hypothetical protein PARMER_00351 [Parabacteroides merdae ATCC 43184]